MCNPHAIPEIHQTQFRVEIIRTITYGGICTKATAPRELDGPQDRSIEEVSFTIQSATDGSTQSSILCVVVAFPRDFPPRESKNQRIRIGLSSDGDLYTYGRKQPPSEGRRRIELGGAHRHPVIPWPALTADSAGCQASVGVGGDKRFALNLYEVADIRLVVVVLGGNSHFLVPRSSQMKYTPCTLEKGMPKSTSGLTISSMRWVEFSLNVSGEGNQWCSCYMKTS